MIDNSKQTNICMDLEENKIFNLNNININTNCYNNHNNNEQNLKLWEIESIKDNNSCDNDSIFNKKKSLNERNGSKLVDQYMTSSDLSSIPMINKLKTEPKLIEIESDDSLKDDNECRTESIDNSVLFPSIASNSLIDNSSQILLSELTNNESTNSHKIVNNSVPVLIIPSTNHSMIGSTFSGLITV